MLNIKRSNIQRCVATGEKNVRAVLNQIFNGEQFEIFLGMHADEGPVWRVFNGETCTMVLDVEAPASIWEVRGHGLVMIPESWWNDSSKLVVTIH